jgi:hypothetical protein
LVGKLAIGKDLIEGHLGMVNMMQVDKIDPLEPTPIFMQSLVSRCHVLLPDTTHPTSAIRFEGDFYVFVKCFPSVEAAREKADMLRRRGDLVILTRVPKGLVLWVLEPDAQLAEKKVYRARLR